MRAFLRASLADLPDPETIPGLAQAASVVAKAVARGDLITVYGDYDADGVCACAILIRGLQALGGRLIPYIPHRLQEGYGLCADAVYRIAQGGTRLLLAVDCGITAVEEIALARHLGMEVVVLDHHEPPPHLPAADVLVDPKLAGQDFRELCAAGLAWLLVRALWARGGLWCEDDLVELAAIGTLADVVPLVGPNRILAKAGLGRLPHSPLPGLQALLRQTGLVGRVTADDVVWRVAPRLNASGRLESAQRSLALLLTDDPDEAEELSAQLEVLNRERQRLQDEVVQQALAAAEALDPRQRATLVLWGEWHPGVLGIAAGKVREAYYRPTILLNVGEGIARGSGRSVPEVNLIEALRACTSLLGEFGGHAQAAGLSLPVDHLEAFRDRFEEAVRGRVQPEDLVPTLELDAELSLSELDRRLLEELRALEPFGAGNPRPLFAVRGLWVVDIRPIGNDGSHLHLQLTDGRHRVEAVGFGWREAAESLAFWGSGVDVAAFVEEAFLDRSEVRLVIQDLRPSSEPAFSHAEQLLEHLFERASEYWHTSRVRDPVDQEGPASLPTGDAWEGRLLYGEVLPEWARGWIGATREQKGVLVGGPGRGLWKVLLVGIADAARSGHRVICVWPTHDLADVRWAQWDPRLRACGIRARRVHGLAPRPADPEAPVVFTTLSYLLRHPDLLRPDDLLVGESLLLPPLALRHPGLVRWNLWSSQAVPEEWVVVFSDQMRTDLVLNDRRGRAGIELVEELVASGSRVVVFEAGPQEAVRLAEVLQNRFSELSIAYDHPLLPMSLRTTLHALLSTGHLRVLVCAGPPPEEGSTRADHLVWRSPQSQALFLLQAASAAPGRERVTLHLAFDREDLRRAEEALDAYPTRPTLTSVYRRLRAGIHPLASAVVLPAALAILEELGVVARTEQGWRVRPGRADLRTSGRFLEGEVLRRAVKRGARWMLRAGAVEILEALAGPAGPR